jgi:glycosyltransferase involved in cell wall biosynthesis
MRIVYLHQYFVTPQMAGGGRSYEMARRLVSMGHEVHMITSDQEGGRSDAKWRETLEAGIHVHWTPVPYDNVMGYGARIRAFFTFAWRAARKAAAIRADVIFATSTPLTIALPAVYASWRSRVPMVFEVRDLWPAVPIAIGAIRNPLAKWAAIQLERFAYRHAARIVALAPGMGSEIIATGYPAQRVAIIPNGCDLDNFSNASPAQELRRQYAWLGDRPLLVFAGTFGLVNGMEYLVRLAGVLSAIDPEVRIVAVGTGRQFDATRRMAIELNVLDKNLFLLGKQTKQVAAAWTVAADMTIALFTGPSIVWRDAVQNKFFDSLAAGKPIASNFSGWQSNLAVEAGAGLILSADSIESAAEDLMRALRDPRWLEETGRAARQLAVGRFNRDVLAVDLARILGEACGQAH